MIIILLQIIIQYVFQERIVSWINTYVINIIHVIHTFFINIILSFKNVFIFDYF